MLDNAVSFSVTEPEPGAASAAGEKLALSPVGNELAASARLALKPPLTATLSVTVALEPCANETDVALSVSCSPGAGVAASPQWFTSRVASTEPSPVAAS